MNNYHIVLTPNSHIISEVVISDNFEELDFLYNKQNNIHWGIKNDLGHKNNITHDKFTLWKYTIKYFLIDNK